MITLYTHNSLRARDLFSLALRVFKTKPLRMVLTILGMGVGVGVVLFLVSFGYGLQYILLGNIASTEDALVTIEAYYPSESRLKINSEIISKISQLQDVSEVSPVYEMTAEVRTGETSGYVLARVIDDKYFRLSGVTIEKFDPTDSPPQKSIISKSALIILGSTENDIVKNPTLNIDLVAPLVDARGVDLDEVGITSLKNIPVGGFVADETEPPLIIIPRALSNQTSARYEKIYVKASSVDSVSIIKDKLIDLGFAVSARLDLINQARKILTAATVMLGVFGVVSLIVSAIGMFNTMIILFMERTFEVGIMKALGARDKDIRNLFLVEALLVGFLGGLGGILLGIAFSDLFNLGLNIVARNLGGKPLDLFIRPWWFMTLIIVISSVIGILSGIVPAIRAAKLSPKKAFAKK